MENMVGQKAVLSEDVHSCFNSKKGKEKYGSKGDEVEVISESYPALIVKGKTGVLFPVNQSKVEIKNRE